MNLFVRNRTETRRFLFTFESLNYEINDNLKQNVCLLLFTFKKFSFIIEYRDTFITVNYKLYHIFFLHILPAGLVYKVSGPG